MHFSLYFESDMRILSSRVRVGHNIDQQRSVLSGPTPIDAQYSNYIYEHRIGPISKPIYVVPEEAAIAAEFECGR